MMYGSGDTNNPLYYFSAYDSNNIGVGFGAYVNTAGSIRMSTTSTSWLLGKNSNGLSIVKCDGTVGSVATQNYILHFATNGNVGVGTTSPTDKLHVVGNIKSTGSIDTDIQFLGQASDSATGPSFSWTGDTNTGFYRPVADTLGFVTNGAERIRVVSTGNVGIGTTSPAYTLDVTGSFRLNSTAVQNLVIGSTSGTANHSTY